MNDLEWMAEYVVDSKNKELSMVEQTILSNHILDTIGALITGRFTSEGRKLANLGGILSGKPGDTASLLDKVMVYSSITRATDIDDIHLPSCTTPGSVVVPVALAMVPYIPSISSKSFLDGVLVGYEALTRLGKAIRGSEVLYKGIWPTSFCAAFGAAATASHLLGLTKKQTVHTLSLALTLSTGGTGKISGDFSSRWLTLGNATRSGCLAALSIQQGYSADIGLFTNKWFQRTYGLEVETDYLTEDLGQKSVLHELSMKPFCSAKQVIAAIHGMSQILSKGVNPRDILEVRISVPPCYAAMIDHDITSKDRLSSITSAPYQVALAAFQPDMLFNVNRTDIEKTEEISVFMQKVTIIPDPALLSYYPRNWPAKVEVFTANNFAEALIIEAPGDPVQPFNSQQVHAKFRRFVEPVMGERRVAELIQLTSDALINESQLLELSKQINEMMIHG